MWVLELDNCNIVDVKVILIILKLVGKLKGNYNFLLENFFEIKCILFRYL